MKYFAAMVSSLVLSILISGSLFAQGYPSSCEIVFTAPITAGIVNLGDGQGPMPVPPDTYARIRTKVVGTPHNEIDRQFQSVREYIDFNREIIPWQERYQYNQLTTLEILSGQPQPLTIPTSDYPVGFPPSTTIPIEEGPVAANYIARIQSYSYLGTSVMSSIHFNDSLNHTGEQDSTTVSFSGNRGSIEVNGSIFDLHSMNIFYQLRTPSNAIQVPFYWLPYAVMPSFETSVFNIGKFIDQYSRTTGNISVRVNGAQGFTMSFGGGSPIFAEVHNGYTIQGFCHQDSDSDYIPDHVDNCPNDNNTDQIDSNGNGIGDACDEEPVFVINMEPIDRLENLKTFIRNHEQINDSESDALIALINNISSAYLVEDPSIGQAERCELALAAFPAFWDHLWYESALPMEVKREIEGADDSSNVDFNVFRARRTRDLIHTIRDEAYNQIEQNQENDQQHGPDMDVLIGQLATVIQDTHNAIDASVRGLLSDVMGQISIIASQIEAQLISEEEAGSQVIPLFSSLRDIVSANAGSGIPQDLSDDMLLNLDLIHDNLDM